MQCRNFAANTYYVDPAGKDTNPGSVIYPFRTIQHAVTVASAAYDGNGHANNINIAFGAYVENVIITRPMQLAGPSPSPVVNESASLTGDVLVQLAGTLSILPAQVAIFALLIVGQVIDTSGFTSAHTLVIKDASINAAEWAVNQSSTSDVYTYLENVTITGDSTVATNPLVQIASGVLSMRDCVLTSMSPAQVVFALSGNFTVMDTCDQNSFINTSASADIQTLVLVATKATATPKQFTSCAFEFSDDTTTRNPSDVATQTNTGIFIVGTALTASVVYVLSSFFILRGTTVADNLAVNAAPSQSLVYYANNVEEILDAATTIVGVNGTSKFLLPAVA